MVAGNASEVSDALQEHIVDIALTRKDCVAFISPPQSAVVNNAGSEQTSITSWNTALSALTGGPAGSYAVADSGWNTCLTAITTHTVGCH